MEYTIHRFESTPSTNDTASRMARDGAPEGIVIVAREQTAGRGRHGRSWTSPPGEGLYMSLVLRPHISLESAWQFSFIGAVAVAESVERVSGLPAKIKWPNDILISGRKIAGVLVDARRLDESLSEIIVGIGININNSGFPPDIAEHATSMLMESGCSVAPDDVEKALLSALEARYAEYLGDGFDPIFHAWKNLDCTVGRHVVVKTSEGAVEGTALEIDENGDLILSIDGEGIRRISAGDVILPTG